MDKKPTVILLSAKSGHGKDFIANIMKEKLEQKGNKVLITHYADLLKYILKTFFNWDGQKDEHGRHLLQYVGTDVIRKQEPDYWINFIKDIITMFPNEWDYILIPDARFPNEVTAMYCEDFGTISVRIRRINYTSKLTEEQQQHESETALDSYSFDYYMTNDGTLDGVTKEVDNFIKVIDCNKKTIFIDMDCTLYNTVKRITEIYDEDFQYYSDYKKIPWEEVTSWNFNELSAAPEKYIDHYFNQKRFFDKVEMYPYAKEVIDKLSDKYRIVFVSHGYSPNLRLKREYIKNNFPYADFIGVNLKEHKDKSCVDMSGDGNIFIDDIPENLYKSNADIKICYGIYDWNSTFTNTDNQSQYWRAFGWSAIENILNSIK